MIRRSITCLFVAVALAAAGCGGGGGGQTAGIDRGGAPSPAAVSGTATGFGSVIVNGTRYATGAAEVTVDGALATEADIMPGHVVSVIGEIDAAGTRTATRVALLHDVEGVIEQLDVLGREFVVLGQTITTDHATSFDGAIATRSLAGLNVGLAVEVSGFRTAAGTLRASRIELDNDVDPYRVRGSLASVDTAVRTAILNGLTIDYSTASIEGFATGQPASGDYVLAEGSTLSSPRRLVAARLVRTSGAPLDLSVAGTAAEVEGLITRFASSADFDVDGQRVSAGAQTVFVRGTASALTLNARVEVLGSAAAGVLNATEVVFAPVVTTRLQSDIEAIDGAARTVTLLGTIVRVLAETTVEDSRDDERVFDTTDLRVGDQLEVYGYDDPPGGTAVVAVRLEREDDGGFAEITGIVRSVSDPEFRILGVRVLTTVDTEFDDITRSELFTAGVGLRLEVEGVYANGILTAEAIELAD